MFFNKKRKKEGFRSLAGCVFTYPEMYSVEKDFAYDLYTRSAKGNPGSQFEAYKYARGMREIVNPSFDERTSTVLLEKAVLSSFDFAEIREGTRKRVIANDLTLTGDESVTADNQKAAATFLATVDSQEAGIPVLFKLATFVEADIDKVESGGETLNKAHLVGEQGVTVNTGPWGVATITITFNANIEKTGNLTATIDDAHRWVGQDKTDTLEVDVDTTSTE